MASNNQRALADLIRAAQQVQDQIRTGQLPPGRFDHTADAVTAWLRTCLGSARSNTRAPVPSAGADVPVGGIQRAASYTRYKHSEDPPPRREIMPGVWA